MFPPVLARRGIWRLFAVSLAALGMTLPLQGQAPRQQEASGVRRSVMDPLTREEIALAQRVALDDPRVKEMLGSAPRRVAYVEFFAGKANDERDVVIRHAEVVFYVPRENRGVRALVLLERRTVAEVEPVEGDDVPISAEEVAEASALALKSPGLRSLVEGASKEYRPEVLRVIATEESDPCWKRRCVEVFFRRGRVFVGASAIVDLLSARVLEERKRQ